MLLGKAKSVNEEENNMEQKIVNTTKFVVDDLIALAATGGNQLVVDYDHEADVLYVNFGDSKKADNSYQDDEGIIRRTKKNKLVGLTILNASRFNN